MRRKAARVALIAITVVLAGCGTWHRANTTEAEFMRDKYDCERDAASMYPVQMTSAGGGYTTPSQTTCNRFGNQMTCNTTPGTYVAPVQTDTNVYARIGAQRSCLQSKGYVWKAS